MPTNAEKGQEVRRRFSRLRSDRMLWDNYWEAVAAFFIPTAKNFRSLETGGSRGTRLLDNRPMSAERAKRRSDSVGIVYLERLAARMYALNMPATGYWHGITAQGFELSDDSATHEGQVWLESVRNDLFNYRYAPRAGFVTATQKAIRSAVAFGHGIVMVEDGASFTDPILSQQVMVYHHVPVSDAYMDVNAADEVDTIARLVPLSIRQVIQRFGEDALTPRMKGLRAQRDGMDQMVSLIHEVRPRTDFDPDLSEKANINMPWRSIWVDDADGAFIAEGGYKAMPYVVYYWARSENSVYGESPCIQALDEVRGKNMIKKISMQSLQQSVKPPMGMPHDGMGRLDLNPGAMNPGAIGAQGEVLVKPLITTGDVNAAIALMDREDASIGKLMLADYLERLDAKMAARTEMEMMRYDIEEAKIMSPIGDRIRMANAMLVEREMTIIFAQGYGKGDMNPPPDILAGKQTMFTSTSPLDDLRNLPLVPKIGQYMEISKAFPDQEEVAIQIDTGKTLKFIRSALGIPAELARSPDEIKQMLAARAERQSQSDALAASESMGKTIKSVEGVVKDPAALSNVQDIIENAQAQQ